jgi:ribonuclease HI
MMARIPSILNWNIRGFNVNRNELELLINEFNPIFISLQETKLKADVSFKNYKIYNKIKDCSGGGIASGGVMILADSSLHTELIDLDTTLQAIAIQTSYPTNLVLCNIYLDHGLRITDIQDKLDHLIHQLGPNFILTGDFNAHSASWGSHKTDGRGKTIDDLIDEHSLIIKNENLPTHIASTNNRLTAIDVTLCTENLSDEFEWTVLDDVHNSDHFPILLTFNQYVQDMTRRQIFNIKKADWTKYRQNINFDDLDRTNIDTLTKDITNRILEAAKSSMPVSKGLQGRKKLPYWNEDIKNKIIDRKKAIREFKRTLDSNTKEKISRLSTEIHEMLEKYKKQSWNQFTSSINHKATSKEVFDKVRTLNGKSKSTAIKTIIDENGQQVHNQTLISNILKNSLEETYNDASNQNSRQNIPQDNDNNCYNEEISLLELEQALLSCNGSSPGPDDIHYEMIKQLDIKDKKTLLELYNKIYNEGHVPKNWKHSLVIPIKKQGKDPRHSQNYRPISLTSCLSKTFERIINRRLQWTLERKGLLNEHQSGFRKRRGTTDNIAYLTDEIQKSFIEQKQTVAIFIDIQKAYDTIRADVVIDSLLKMGFKGKIVRYIQNFLTDRTFCIQLGGIHSRIGHMGKGIPQGSVISCTLFNIVFNEILNHIDEPIKYCAYADDLVIFSKGKTTKEIEARLQTTFDRINLNMKQRGLIISKDKTKSMLFSTKHKRNIEEPKIKLDRQVLESVKKFTFLGVTFDTKLNWTKHIENTTAKTKQNLRVIRMLSNTTYGSDRKTLLKLHDALISSINNYGAIALNNLTKNQDNKLNAVHMKSLKYAIGAFVTSPNKSVEVEAGVVPIKHQRAIQRLKYTFKILTNDKHPLYTSLKDTSKDAKYSSRTKPPVTFTLRQDLQSLSIDTNTKINQTQNTYFPPWTKTRHKYDISLTKFNKHNTSNEVLKTEFNRKINKLTEDMYEPYYTDGSKTDDGYGCAVIEEGFAHKYKCQDYCSVYTTELIAIAKAIDIAERKKKSKIVICTDSLSAVNGIQDSQTKHPLIMEIQDKLKKTRMSVILMWIPSHVGIIGNEKADLEAKEATKQVPDEQHRIIRTDIDRSIKESIRKKWQVEWNDEISRQNKLGTLKKTVDKWKTIDLQNRKDQTVITRLRLGHTRMTHGHLIERTNPPTCSCAELLTVKHMLSCNLNKTLQDKHKVNFDTLGKDSKNELLKVVEYLKELDFYDKI